MPGDGWFQPFAKVVSEDGHDIQALGVRRASEQDETFTAEFKAGMTGSLYLFVDDAVIPSWLARALFGEEQSFYANNTGTAVVAVYRSNGPAR